MKRRSKLSTIERISMRKLWRVAPLVAVAAVALGISACGSSSSSSSSSASGTSGKKGGTPNATEPAPDLATGAPVVSDGGKTITITIKSGIKYSAPLQNRTVQAADIAYAMNRCLVPRTGNGYAGAYFTPIVGATAVLGGKATKASGITAPNATTLVLKLATPEGILANGQALALPCTTPVPEDYAKKYDTGTASTYGMHQVFTGPYMIKGAGTGTVPSSGYAPNSVLDLVRNPSWDASTDSIRHAYLDEIVMKEGFTTDVAARQILNGSHMLSGDWAAPPPAIAKQYLQAKASQFHVEASQGNRFIGLDPKIPPLNNINVRKAIIAVTDRNALLLTRGGPYIGTVATHFLPPSMQGFDVAGGNAGPGFDFYANPNGDVALAQSYMKKAGYASGKYTGPPLLMVADAASPAKETAEAFAGQIAQIGIKVNLQEVPHKTMYSKFCQVPKNQPPLCPNLGWEKDFFDSQSMLDPLYNGANIAQTGNTNYAQLNDPAINASLNQAKQITDPTARANAYGQLDKQLTGLAYYDMWVWDNDVGLQSSDVNGVWNKFDADWDYTSISLK
jgi:peptide/nickel transport system substrate-binding protein